MKNKIILVILFSTLLLAACGKAQPVSTADPTEIPAATPTAIVDPCSPLNLPDEATRVNKLMREFDDYSELASNTPQAQLIQIVPELQRVLRDAEDQQVPACLKGLKQYQLAHMNVVVQTLMSFMANADPELINAGIGQARQLRNQYDLELARLLGITLVVPPTPTAVPGTPVSDATPAVIFATNSTAASITLLLMPDPNAGGVAMLEAGLTTVALGQSADGKWIQVEVPGQPGQKAWVDASLVAVSGSLPVVTP